MELKSNLQRAQGSDTNMKGNINPRFERAIHIAEQEAQQKEALKREKIAKERENGNAMAGIGL